MARRPAEGVVDEIGSARAQPAAAAPKPVAVAKKPAKPKSGLFYFLSLLGSFGICGLFPATTLLVAACMLPTVIMYLLDVHPRRHATKTVAWANLAGALIMAMELWSSERSLDTAFDIMVSPFTWATVLCAASIGWAIQFVVPRMVRGYLDISHKVQQKDLTGKQTALEKEWGMDVRDEAPIEELEMARAEVKAMQELADELEEEAAEEAAEAKEDAAKGAPS